MNHLKNIEKRLERWEKDLNPVYDNKIEAFFGRLIRKLESGVQKLGFFLFITHKWESKQERCFNFLKKRLREVKRYHPSFYKQIKTMILICDLLLQKKDKINKSKVESLKHKLCTLSRFQKYVEIKQIPEEKNFKDFRNAIENNDIENTRRLITKKYVNQPVAVLNFFPIHQAAELGNLEILNLLLPLTSHVDVRVGHSHETSLHIAAAKGHREVVKFLLENGADPYAKNINDEIPFHRALIYGHLNLLDLLKPNPIDITDNRGQSGLFKVMTKDNKKEVLEYLIQQGANPSLRDKKGRIPLHVAAKMGTVKLMEVLVPLLKFPDDINIQDDNGRNLLSSASSSKLKFLRNDVRETITFLLRNNVQKDTGDKKGKLPFHYAAENGLKEGLDLLVPNDINIKDKNGRTALSWAASGLYGKHSIPWLLDHEASKNIPDNKGRLPFHYAAKMEDREGFIVLKELEPLDIDTQDHEGRTALSFAAAKNSRAVEHLLERGANQHIADKRGNLPLHYAVRGGFDCVKELSAHYKDIDVKGQDGRTALSLAVEQRNLNIVQFLLEKGAKAHLADKNGNTPLHNAASTSCVDIVRVLINYLTKDQINLKNKQGKTASMIAEEAGQNEVLQELEQALAR